MMKVNHNKCGFSIILFRITVFCFKCSYGEWTMSHLLFSIQILISIFLMFKFLNLFALGLIVSLEKELAPLFEELRQVVEVS